MMSQSIALSAQLTYIRVRGLYGHFIQAARRHQLPAPLLLAVASRESNMGLALEADWTGDHGNGIGIMQIDRRYHPEFTAAHPNDDHRANIDYGAQFLAGLVERFDGKLEPSLAAYNAGEARVRMALTLGSHPDKVTTGGNYSADVLQRARQIESLLRASNAARTISYLIPAGLIGLFTYHLLTPKTT